MGMPAGRPNVKGKCDGCPQTPNCVNLPTWPSMAELATAPNPRGMSPWLCRVCIKSMARAAFQPSHPMNQLNWPPGAPAP